MTRFLSAALLALLALPAQAATCLLHADGVTWFDGPCRFLPYGGDGSFQIQTLDGWSVVEVSVLEPGVAEGWWNEANGAAIPNVPLGTLHRDNRDPACWLNGYATVCAW
jgi:hypothetical protein